MAYMTFLADVLRAAGLPVREVAGWRTRGHGAMHDQVLGVLAHHTAGAATGLYPSERVVVQGRPGLEGPLCNLGLDRAGTWIVVAAGQAWHAGSGSISWCPANQGNSRLIGVEAESVGTRDDWSAAQRQSYPRGVAALLAHLRLPASRAIGHKEWAPSRKIDPAFWDMNTFRADVARWMTTPAAGGSLMALSDAEQDELLREVRGIRELLLRLKPGLVLPARSKNCRPAQDDDFGASLNAWAEAADARAAVEQLGARLASGTSAAPGALSDADLDRIAARVVDLLSRRTAS